MPAPIAITPLPATDADLSTVEHLVALYLHDMSEFTGWPCPESGRFGGCDEFFADWRAGRNHPFVLRVGGELAGFAGVRLQEDGKTHEIQEFFLLRKFRHRGLAQQAASRLFHQFPGPWLVEWLVDNTPAAHFWEAVIRAAAGTFAAGTHGTPWGPRAVCHFTLPPGP